MNVSDANPPKKSNERGTHGECDGVKCSGGEVAERVLFKKFWAVMDECSRCATVAMRQEDGIEL